METAPTEAVTVTRPQYTITLVCPICHQPINWQADGVLTCPHCKLTFRLQTAPGPQEFKGAQDD